MIACDCPVCTSPDKKDNRLRASIMVQSQTTTLVIDSGPDFRYQMLRARVKHLDAIIFTHSHKDHIAGMDDIRAFNYVLKRKVDIYAMDRVQKAIEREFPYIFEEIKYPGVPEITIHTISNDPFEIDGVKIIPIEVMHYRLPVFGYRFGHFTYITDANFISPKEKEKIRGSKIIVINALRREPHISHFTMEEAVKMLEELAPEQGYLTHISHQLGRNENVNAELPSFIRCAYDGLVLEI